MKIRLLLEVAIEPIITGFECPLSVSAFECPLSVSAQLTAQTSVCTLSNINTFSMAQDARTQVTIGGTVLTTSNSEDYSSVYLGEEVEFSCKPAYEGGK